VDNSRAEAVDNSRVEAGSKGPRPQGNSDTRFTQD